MLHLIFKSVYEVLCAKNQDYGAYCMNPSKQFQQQFGGLYTAALPYEQIDPIHRGALGGVLRDAVKHEAKVHGAAFDHAGFRNVMKAMAAGDVEVLFFAAAWDLCEPKIIGATINFPSLSLQREGNDIIAKRGIYSEDVCILPGKVKELILDKPTGGDFPTDGLGMHFIRASIGHFAKKGLRGGMIPAGQVFEFAPENGKIVKIQQQLGAELGQSHNSGLLRLDTLTDTIRNQWKMPVEVLGVALPNGEPDPNNFIVRWHGANGRQKIEAAFTKGLSTFKGTTVTQAQFISNGHLPNKPMVESVAASILKAADEEIRMRRWGRWNNHLPERFSPSIPLLGDKRQIFSALMQAQINDLCAPATDRDSSLLVGLKPPPLHIHALNEPALLTALCKLGAETRMLGPHAMQTASLDLDKASAAQTPTSHVQMIGPERAKAPQFTLAS